MEEKILVTGGSGMVGKAIESIYKKIDFSNKNKKFIFMSSNNADLN